jgi:hypothetical protein
VHLAFYLRAFPKLTGFAARCRQDVLAMCKHLYDIDLSDRAIILSVLRKQLLAHESIKGGS